MHKLSAKVPGTCHSAFGLIDSKLAFISLERGLAGLLDFGAGGWRWSVGRRSLAFHHMVRLLYFCAQLDLYLGLWIVNSSSMDGSFDFFILLRCG